MKNLSRIVPAVLVIAACGGESTPEPHSTTSVTSEPPPAAAGPESATTTGAMPPASSEGTSAPMEAGPSAEPPSAAAQAAPAPATLTDTQVAAVTDAANTGEVEQAKVAQKRAKDARVKKFATMMIAHHTEAKQKQAKLLTKLKMKPEENPESTAITAEGTQVVETLKSIDAGSFDASYIASQVDQHQKVLTRLDNLLIPSAKDPELKASLVEFRPRVEAHLKEAMDIQQALPARTSSAAPGGASGASQGAGSPSVGMNR